MRLLVSVLVVLAVGAASAAADVSGPDIVSFLNAQRAANGIPAGIVEDPALSDGCAKANGYDRQNHELTHSEDSGAAGYTPEGAAAANEAVLYTGGPWTATSNPFETAPIHLHQLLAPRLDRMGASENDGYGCATTLASLNRAAPAADVTYTYPGNGVTGWPVAETAAEGPYTPGSRVGIPGGARTGPYLYVMFDGPELHPGEDASAATATLTGPGGPVDVAVADNTTDGLQQYLPTGAEIIPRAALQPFTSYHATVTASVDGRTFTHAWTFTTGGTLTGRGFAVSRATVRRRRVALTVTPQVPVTIRIRVTGKGRSTALPVQRIAGRRTLIVRVPHGFGAHPKVRLRVTVAGRTTTVVRHPHLS